MAESHVVSGLVAKRSELSGLLAHHQQQIALLNIDLQHLDATLKLFDPEIDLRTIRPKTHRRRNQYFKPGECHRTVLDIFREAQGAPLSSRQIGQQLTQRKGLPMEDEIIEQMQKNVLTIIKRLEIERIIFLAEEKDGAGRTWKLA